jgi:hypothetical protein
VRTIPSYRERLQQIDSGRGGKKKIGKSLYISKALNGDILFQLWGETVATLSPENILTYVWAGDMCQTTMRRFEKVSNNVILFCSDKSRHKNKKQCIRVNHPYSLKFERWYIRYGSESVPYTPGMEFYLTGEMRNRDICKDYIRVLDKSAAAKIRKSINEITAYSRTIARLDEVPQSKELYLDARDILLERAKAGFPDPSFDDVLKVYVVGECSTVMRGWNYQPQAKEKDNREFFRRCVENGLKYLRTELYKSSNLYSYVPVGEVNQSTKEQSCN